MAIRRFDNFARRIAYIPTLVAPDQMRICAEKWVKRVKPMVHEHTEVVRSLAGAHGGGSLSLPYNPYTAVERAIPPIGAASSYASLPLGINQIDSGIEVTYSNSTD